MQNQRFVIIFMLINDGHGLMQSGMTLLISPCSLTSPLQKKNLRVSAKCWELNTLNGMRQNESSKKQHHEEHRYGNSCNSSRRTAG